MSNLLNLLKSEGSVLTSLDGKTPKSFDGTSQYEKSLATSQLDLDGKTPLQYDRQTIQIAGLEKSQLDLNGVTPEKYLDNLPR
jgi:hypothetical protein